MADKPISAEALLDLRRRLSVLPPRSAERRQVMQDTANLYGVSEPTLYRVLRQRLQPRALQRADYGQPRILSKEKMGRYCELVAAIKIRTRNKQGRHLSTGEAIRLLEVHGLETPGGFIKAPPGLLKIPTLNRYLKRWGYDLDTLSRPPPAVRFQARHSNECWHFDLSPSDLKHIPQPAWIAERRGPPLLMLYSVVDDRSGVAYQEYHSVYGEDVEAALRFLFNAMAPKSVEGFPFGGRPGLIYADNGPIARSHVFQQVMGYLGIEVRTHLPQGKDGRRPTARSKGKVERPFRTVKEMHETLFHFHAPETEVEANAWLMQFLLRYNTMPHRSEPHSRLEDWVENLPAEGLREMCSWERFCTFAREPERRKVGVDARVVINGTAYEVDPDLAGETVVLWWGVFDNALYVEHAEARYGPYAPVGGPIPLNHYRRFRKTKVQERADRVEALAKELSLPRSALGEAVLMPSANADPPPVEPFRDPDPFQEITYPSVVAAKRAIADYLAMPLAKLSREEMDKLDAALAESLRKTDVIEYARAHLEPLRRGSRPC